MQLTLQQHGFALTLFDIDRNLRSLLLYFYVQSKLFNWDSILVQIVGFWFFIFLWYLFENLHFNNNFSKHYNAQFKLLTKFNNSKKNKLSKTIEFNLLKIKFRGKNCLHLIIPSSDKKSANKFFRIVIAVLLVLFNK